MNLIYRLFCKIYVGSCPENDRAKNNSAQNVLRLVLQIPIIMIYEANFGFILPATVSILIFSISKLDLEKIY